VSPIRILVCRAGYVDLGDLPEDVFGLYRQQFCLTAAKIHVYCVNERGMDIMRRRTMGADFRSEQSRPLQSAQQPFTIQLSDELLVCLGFFVRVEPKFFTYCEIGARPEPAQRR